VSPGRSLSDREADRLAVTLLDAACGAAAACEAWVGKGDKNAADFAAVEAMRGALLRSGQGYRIATGEGEIDRAPMMNRGEQIGPQDGVVWDIAVDPLEGTTLCAEGRPGAVTAIAGGACRSILSAPDTYLAKVMAGPACPAEAVHIDAPVAGLICAYARAADKPIAEVTVCVLDRPRHANLVATIRSAGARVKTIQHGDLPAALWVCRPERFGVDLYVGTGGAPEGLLSAVIVKALGGSMSARFAPEDQRQADELADAGIAEATRVFSLDQLVPGEAELAMASVTGTPGLQPAKRAGERVRVEAFSVSTRRSGTDRLRHHSTEIDSA
jgi:fructose-1,6-bisphosphatase/sedoheptulose 1,7-bisphosphatase-like protein